MNNVSNREGSSKVIISALIVCIILVLALIFSNIYYIGRSSEENKIPNNISTEPDFNSSVNFISNVISCGSGENKHITVLLNSSGNPDLYGVRFIATDNLGSEHIYTNNTREALPFGEAIKKMEISFLNFNLDPSLNITKIRAILIFQDMSGGDILGGSTPITNVCYSSCNDCSAACEIVCPK